MKNDSEKNHQTPSILETATRIAVRAHATQKRKEGNLPYVSHPFMVAVKTHAI